MRKIKLTSIFIIGLLFITVAFSSIQEAASSNIDIQTVGYDIGDFNGVDGNGAVPPVPDAGDTNEGSGGEGPSVESPDEYDPENPYGQWE